MYLIEILLPLQDESRKPFPAEPYERLAQRLTERFGGVTSFSRAPAEGRWKSQGTTGRDDIVVVESWRKTSTAHGGLRFAKTLCASSGRTTLSSAARRSNG
jgi:hypothetical protein